MTSNIHDTADAREAELMERIRRLEEERGALARELERWRHGKQIEGDYVCDYAVRHLEAEQQNARLREALEAVYEAFRDTGLENGLPEVDDLARAALLDSAPEPAPAPAAPNDCECSCHPMDGFDPIGGECLVGCCEYPGQILPRKPATPAPIPEPAAAPSVTLPRADAEKVREALADSAHGWRTQCGLPGSIYDRRRAACEAALSLLEAALKGGG